MTEPTVNGSVKAPGHLRAATRRWFSEVLEGYSGLEAHHVRLLVLAAEAFDRAQEARRELARSGAYFTDEKGLPRAHPAIAVERDSQIRFARLMRELRLDDAPEPDVRVPRRG